jgi:hypothetical protein
VHGSLQAPKTTADDKLAVSRRGLRTGRATACAAASASVKQQLEAFVFSHKYTQILISRKSIKMSICRWCVQQHTDIMTHVYFLHIQSKINMKRHSFN